MSELQKYGLAILATLAGFVVIAAIIALLCALMWFVINYPGIMVIFFALVVFAMIVNLVKEVFFK